MKLQQAWRKFIKVFVEHRNAGVAVLLLKEKQPHLHVPCKGR